MKPLIASIAIAGVLLTGCETLGITQKEKPQETALITLNHGAVETLVKNINVPLDKERPIIVATLVNVDDLNESSRFGRITSEQVSGALSNHKFRPIELKLRGELFMKRSEGELLLSREVRDISTSHFAQAVVVGTYAIGKDKIYVNLKVVDAAGNKVIGAHDYEVPVDKNIRSLLPNAKP